MTTIVKILVKRLDALQTRAEALTEAWGFADIAGHNRLVSPIYSDVKNAERALEGGKLDAAARSLDAGERRAVEADAALASR